MYVDRYWAYLQTTATVVLATEGESLTPVALLTNIHYRCLILKQDIFLIFILFLKNASLFFTMQKKPLDK